MASSWAIPLALGWEVPGSQGPLRPPPRVHQQWPGSGVVVTMRTTRPVRGSSDFHGHPQRPPTAEELAQTVVGEPPAPSLTQDPKPGPQTAGGPSGDLPHPGQLCSILPPPSPRGIEPSHKDAGGGQELASSPELTPTEGCLLVLGLRWGHPPAILSPAAGGWVALGLPQLPGLNSGPPPSSRASESRALCSSCVSRPASSILGGWAAGGLTLMFPEPHCFCSKAYGAPTEAFWVEEGVAIQGAPSPRYPSLAGETAP